MTSSFDDSKSTLIGSKRKHPAVFSTVVHEEAISPRTRLTNYAQFLRPLSSQLIRAAEATKSSNIQLTRHEAARAYYRLGELMENGEALIAPAELENLHRQLDLLFHETIAPHSLEQTRTIFKSFLFKIESKQPSSLTLAEMRTLILAGSSSGYLDDLAIVRVAHCLNQGCLALLAAQIELASAYFDFIGADLNSLVSSQPDKVDSKMFAGFLRLRAKLKDGKVTAGNARTRGSDFRKTIKPVLDLSSEILSNRAREYALVSELRRPRNLAHQ